jgi:nitrogen fixation protein FixH
MNAKPTLNPVFSRSMWPVAITLYFVAAFCGVVTFIVWSVHQNQDLVSSDYYEDEILFQNKLDALNRTLPFGKDVSITAIKDQQSIAVKIPQSHARLGPTGAIHFYRPSAAGLDFTIPLSIGQDGMQLVSQKQLKSGLWKVRIEWEVDSKQYLFEKSMVISIGQGL